MQRLAVTIALIQAAVACGGSAPARRDWKAQATAPALAVERARIRSGEVLIWQVSFRGMEVGEMVMATGAAGADAGRDVVIVRSRLQTTGLAALLSEVNDDFTTVIDLETALPIRHHAKVDDDQWREIAFAPGEVTVTYADGDEREQVHQTMPPEAVAFDLNSLLFALRSFSETNEATLHIVGTTMVWRSRIDVRGREQIRTPLGKRDAIRIDGYAERVTRSYDIDASKEPRRYSIWYSADKDRLPLRIVGYTDYGEMQLELVEYRWGDHVLTAALAR